MYFKEQNKKNFAINASPIFKKKEGNLKFSPSYKEYKTDIVLCKNTDG